MSQAIFNLCVSPAASNIFVFCLTLGLCVRSACQGGDAAQRDAMHTQSCEEVVNEFNFGMSSQQGEDGEWELKREDPAHNRTVSLLYDQYEHCVHHLRLLDRGESSAPRFVALGRHHANLLMGPNPNSGFMLLPALDLVVSAFVKMHGTFDELEKSVLANLLRENDTVIEVGANIGVYSIPIAQWIGPGGFLYAFEPFRKVFQILTANVALNGLGNVQTFQAGVGDVTEHVSIRVPSLSNFTNLGAARVFLQQDSDLVNVPFDPENETVEVKRLDDMFWPRKIDFLKIDAEGMEESVVAGADRLLVRDLPLIYVETQPYFYDADMRFINHMAVRGYLCSTIKGLEVHQLLLCVHESRVQELRARTSL